MENSEPDSNKFSVRIVSIDYYMSPPITDLDICYSSFQGGMVNEVPVIRIYGSTPAGQKTCLHVHRALPYLYVPCSDLLQTSEQGDSYARQMSSAIEKALNSKGKSSTGSKRQHVHGCSFVRAKKFYGFHSAEELFVKIYLYYPHEVSRVAAFLLDGAVLDKSYQPHESHIPFLLQFLVDYNLYGMGHLHVSKVMFRYPLPDRFIPKMDQADSSSHSCLGLPLWTSNTIPSGWMWSPLIATNGSPDQEACLTKRQSTCELEGDATVDEIVNQQLKMYTSLSQTRSDVKMVQSLVPIWQEEYERTGMHEEITGYEVSKPSPKDVLRTLSNGPDCESAFMDLCREAEKSPSFQVTPTEESQRFLQSIRSIADVSSLCEMREHATPTSSHEYPFQCSEERNRSGSTSLQGRLSKQDTDVVPAESGLKFPEIVPADEDILSVKKIDYSNSKGIDTETLGLLKWLASSQAEEDLNTDDELGYDLILTPLLPKAAIDTILEKANFDYECESQQECQDILDSVHPTSHNCSTPTTSDNIIPQVDGSCDDLVSGCVDSPSEMDMNNETVRSSRQTLQEMDVGPSNERKEHRKLWCPLPISTQQNVGKNSESSSFNSTDASIEMTNCRISGSSEKRDYEFCNNSLSNANTNNSGLKEQKEVTGSSVRDLMRRKRSRRVEPSDVGTCGLTKIHVGKCQEETSISPKQLEFGVKKNDMKAVIPSRILETPLVSDQEATAKEKSTSPCLNVDGRGLDSGEVQMYEILPLTSCSEDSLQGSPQNSDHLVSCGSRSIDLADASMLHSETEEVPKTVIPVNEASTFGTGQTDCVEVESELFSRRSMPSGKDCQERYTARDGLSEMCSDCYGITDAATNADVQCSKNFAIQKINQTCSPCAPLSTSTTTEGISTKYFELSLSKKPPTLDSENWTSGNASFAPVVHDQSFIANMESSEGTFDCKSNSVDVQGSDADEVPPFFSDNVHAEEVFKSYRSNEVIKTFHEGVLGIPTHYQNNGSLFYLLTTIYSPPSLESVHEWLYHHSRRREATGTSTESVCLKMEVSSCPSSSNSLELSKENASNNPKAASELLNQHAILTSESDMMDSEKLMFNVCDDIFPESGSVPHRRSSMGQLTSKSNRNFNIEGIYPRLTTTLHSKDAVLKGAECTDNWRDVSQISGPELKSKLTPLSQIGFRDPASVGNGQQLSLMSIEVQAESRGDLRPDPRFDAVMVIAVTIQDDNDNIIETFVLLRGKEDEQNQRNLDGVSGYKVLVALEEKTLFYHFVKIVRSSDPDIMMGWEIQGSSLGYLAERAAHLGIVLLDNISRTPTCATNASATVSATQGLQKPEDLLPDALITDPTDIDNAIIVDEWGRTHGSGVHVGGRIVLNIWRLMRGEIKLNMYTLEAVVEEVLRQKVPSIPSRILTQWFLSGPGRARYRCVEYITERAKLNLEIMNKLDMINRTSELARVFGIDFFSVLSRGSQYRVESMFLRLAHTQNYLAISPGNQQVASQPAMECLPLVMEPESRFYADPVVVLDFQSLYPSMIIAYNLCFCTCLGKVIPAKANILGVSSFSPDPQLLTNLKSKILLTPNGVMYVPSEVRKGVLPRLLEEILSTRIMVKRSMKKLTPSQRVLYRIFNARQLALKLISNVTYGYTAAGFSGRMPCAELADSIVQCGRRTLENAISFVNSHDKWNARVIYGDTDSMFVLLKGRNVKESFSIGQEIASAITSMNPGPVTLKMEKVYHPCFLLTKKRYVGYSYETVDQVEPLFDAKGIETVRRDTCGAVAKTLEHSLRIFFEHHDIFKVKVYLQRQWARILGGRVCLQDFVFAKEVRLGTYSTRSSSLPPAAIVATKAMQTDPRAEPRYAERIPYVVIHGEPGARLVDMVVDPLDLLAIKSPFRLNDLYYINKQIIPALQRVFGLVGADLKQWFLQMPRSVRPSVGKRSSYAPNGQRTRIDFYYLSRHCFLCGGLVQASNHLCDKCSKKEQAVAIAASHRTSEAEKEIQHLAAICRHCGGGDWIVERGVKCVSLACTVFYERRKVQKELQALSTIATEMGFYPRCMVEWF